MSGKSEPIVWGAKTAEEAAARFAGLDDPMPVVDDMPGRLPDEVAVEADADPNRTDPTEIDWSRMTREQVEALWAKEDQAAAARLAQPVEPPVDLSKMTRTEVEALWAKRDAELAKADDGSKDDSDPNPNDTPVAPVYIVDKSDADRDDDVDWDHPASKGGVSATKPANPAEVFRPAVMPDPAQPDDQVGEQNMVFRPAVMPDDPHLEDPLGQKLVIKPADMPPEVSNPSPETVENHAHHDEPDVRPITDVHATTASGPGDTTIETSMPEPELDHMATQQTQQPNEGGDDMDDTGGSSDSN